MKVCLSTNQENFQPLFVVFSLMRSLSSTGTRLARALVLPELSLSPCALTRDPAALRRQLCELCLVLSFAGSCLTSTLLWRPSGECPNLVIWFFGLKCASRGAALAQG